MKPIVYRKQFKKNLQKRILPNPKLVKQFEERLKLFAEGVRNYPLDDHALVGTMKGLRAFSIGGDLRVVYQETNERYEFLVSVCIIRYIDQFFVHQQNTWT